MKTAVVLTAITLFAASASVASAMGCSYTTASCAEGYTQDHETGGCVKIATTS